MIKKLTIEAVSIKQTKKDGSPYMWNDKKTNTMKPRVMVSLKSGSDWYIGWSYKTGSAAETLKVGDTPELFITEEADKVDPNKIWKLWKFPKPEDVANQEIANLKAQLSAMKPTIPSTNVPLSAPNAAFASSTAQPLDGSVPASDVPF